MRYAKSKKELEIFMLEVGVGQITFEKKPNGDLIISKQETELFKTK